MSTKLRFVDQIRKATCSGCQAEKSILHFYVDRLSGRVSSKCKLCIRENNKFRRVPKDLGGEWQPTQSGYAGPGVLQFVRARRRTGQ
jgi:hypothetical protein